MACVKILLSLFLNVVSSNVVSEQTKTVAEMLIILEGWPEQGNIEWLSGPYQLTHLGLDAIILDLSYLE